MQEVDSEGLDKQDRRYLETLIRVFVGGPTGVEALAATMTSRSTLSKTRSSPTSSAEIRRAHPPRPAATSAAYLHLGLPEPPPPEPEYPLFDPERRMFE